MSKPKREGHVLNTLLWSISHGWNSVAGMLPLMTEVILTSVICVLGRRTGQRQPKLSPIVNAGEKQCLGDWMLLELLSSDDLGLEHLS